MPNPHPQVAFNFLVGFSGAAVQFQGASPPLLADVAVVAQAVDPSQQPRAQLLVNRVAGGGAVAGVAVAAETWCGGFSAAGATAIGGAFQHLAALMRWSGAPPLPLFSEL